MNQIEKTRFFKN